MNIKELEKEILSVQKDYLQSKNDETLGKLYLLIKELTRILIISRMRKLGLSFDSLVFEEKLEDCTTNIIMRYINPEYKGDFNIREPKAYINICIKDILHNGKAKRWDKSILVWDDIDNYRDI